jgi:hypothetical protein
VEVGQAVDLGHRRVVGTKAIEQRLRTFALEDIQPVIGVVRSERRGSGGVGDGRAVARRQVTVIGCAVVRRRRRYSVALLYEDLLELSEPGRDDRERHRIAGTVVGDRERVANGLGDGQRKRNAGYQDDDGRDRPREDQKPSHASGHESTLPVETLACRLQDVTVTPPKTAGVFAARSPTVHQEVG